MEEINIRVTIVENGLKNFEYGNFYYSNETTVADFVKFVRETIIKNDNDNAYLKFQGQIGYDQEQGIKYIINNGKVEWSVPFDDAKFIDYISTYPSAEQNITYTLNPQLGFAIPPQDILDILSGISTFYGMFIIAKDIKTKLRNKKILKNWKNVNASNNGERAPWSFVCDFIKTQSVWKLDDIVRILSLEDDIPLAIILLKLSGYEFNEITSTYKYVKGLDIKRQSELDRIAKYLDSKDDK